MNNEDVVSVFLKAGILSDKSAIDYITDNDIDAEDIAEKMLASKMYFATKEVIESILAGKDEDGETKVEVKHTGKKSIAKDIDGSVRISSKQEEEQKTKTITDFVAYFSDRYEKIKNILLGHSDVKNPVSINRLEGKANERDVFIIGIISKMDVSKNGHRILEVEDPTGSMTAIIMKDKNVGEDNLIFDEIVAFKGGVSNGTLFVDAIIFPEIPVVNNTDKKVDDPVSSVFISDIHIGSNEYLQKVEDKFIGWLKGGDNGAGDVKYICIAGDTVDGVGIYPGQKADLKIQDIYAQYKAFEEFIERIPEHIEIVIIPGNHDAVRLAEPQPAFGKDLMPNITGFNNVHLGPNPCRVELHGIDGKQGVNVLMYHGYSFTRTIDAVPTLRVNGMDKPEYVMTELLRKRHLAPMYGSTALMPSSDDPHVISRVPDIFHTGDLHSFALKSYRGVQLISSSTFQGQTAFMDRVGHQSNPGKVTRVRLDCMKPSVLDLVN